VANSTACIKVSIKENQLTAKSIEIYSGIAVSLRQHGFLG